MTNITLSKTSKIKKKKRFGRRCCHEPVYFFPQDTAMRFALCCPKSQNFPYWFSAVATALRYALVQNAEQKCIFICHICRSLASLAGYRWGLNLLYVFSRKYFYNFFNIVSCKQHLRYFKNKARRKYTAEVDFLSFGWIRQVRSYSVKLKKMLKSRYTLKKAYPSNDISTSELCSYSSNLFYSKFNLCRKVFILTAPGPWSIVRYL